MLLRIAFLASVAGFLYGYDLGLIGGAMHGISAEFGIHTTSTKELIVAAAKAGAFFGTFLGAAGMLRYGRRAAIGGLGCLFLTGPILMAAAGLHGTHGPGCLIAGRFITGLGIGASAIVVPAYLAELAPAKTRGSIVAIYESPRWLVMRGELAPALGTLRRVQSRAARRQAKASEAAVAIALAQAEHELLRLQSAVEADRAAVLMRRHQLLLPTTALPPPPAAAAEEPGAAGASTKLAAPAPGGAAAGTGEGQRAAAPGGAATQALRAFDIDSGTASGATAPGAAAAAVGGSDPPDVHTQPLGGHDPGREPWFGQTLFWMLADVFAVARGPERRAFAVAVALAFFDQASASTSVINYASTLLASEMGVAMPSALLMPAAIAATKVFGVAVSAAVVDKAGRRPLLIGGGATSAAALCGAAGAVAAGSPGGLLVCMCLFLLGYSLGWAALYWVVVSELFSMTAKSPGSSAATSVLFLTGSVVDLVFLSAYEACGAWAFAIFAAVAAAGAAFVAAAIPETKGRTLLEVQELLQRPRAGCGAAARAGCGGGWPCGGGGGGSGAARWWSWRRRGAHTNGAPAELAAASAAAMQRV
ncbi:MAG: major facilitator superfamily domain-containing protein [Monoraphidium minutum]|nr:MAG: major facilitator superfamily domain-containing protein [Monoraphidium minutum]